MFMDLDFDDTATNAKAGVKFKPKPRPKLRKQASISTSQAVSKEDLYDVTDQSIRGIVSEKNLDEVSRNVHWCIESTDLREQIDVDLENNICGNKYISAILDDRKRQDSEILGVLCSKSRKKENHLDMETQEFHNSFSTGTSDPEIIVNQKPKDEALNSKNVTFDDLVQDEVNPKETVPEMDTGQAPHGWEHEEQAKSPVAGKKGCFEDTARERNVRKSKRVADKKKNIKEEPNQCSEKPQKKRSKQSTRRKTLEKELLKTPEDEIQFLPIKDMLKLVDYREYIERKETKNQESTSKQHKQHFQDDSERFDSDDCRENQEASRVEPDLPVNYHTFGHRTGRSRWSKQDNELFYEGIREFGSNLEMVQQLFPNRSRQQMKLKLKLEERKHPLKLSNALTSRAKHHTHFQNVIKKLQEEAAPRKEEEAESAEEERTDVPQNGKPRKSGVTKKAEVKESDGREPDNDLRSDGREAENCLRSDGGEAENCLRSDGREAENCLRSDGGEAENGLRSDGGGEAENGLGLDGRDEDEVECDYWGNYTSDI